MVALVLQYPDQRLDIGEYELQECVYAAEVDPVLQTLSVLAIYPTSDKSDRLLRILKVESPAHRDNDELKAVLALRQQFCARKSIQIELRPRRVSHS